MTLDRAAQLQTGEIGQMAQENSRVPDPAGGNSNGFSLSQVEVRFDHFFRVYDFRLRL